MKFRAPLLLFVLGIATGVLQAQTPSSTTPSIAEVRTLLESPVAKDQAWGAWWASQGQMRELEPQLQKNLEAQIHTAHPIMLILDTTLDAFIQFGSHSLSVELLQGIYSQRPAPALILLSESNRPRPPVDAFMKTLLGPPKVEARAPWSVAVTGSEETGPGILHARSEWFVAADILLMHRTAGLVGNILRDLQITASVVVCDAAPACESGQRGGGYAGSILGGTRDLSEPPHPTYGLMEPGPDSTVFVRGPSPSLDVAFHRYVVNSEYVMGPIPLVSLPTTAERMTYVAAAAPQLRIPILESPSLKIVYLTESAVEGTVERFRQNIVQSYMSMIS